MTHNFHFLSGSTVISIFIIPPPTQSSGQRYSVFQQRFLSFLVFFFHQRIIEMALPAGNLYSSEDGLLNYRHSSIRW